MTRKKNTTKEGSSWTEATKLSVWKKGKEIPKYSPEVWRKDQCGIVMKWSEHGNRDSDNGWEIDHIDPVSNGGDDSLSNLQPLYWENNLDKGDNLGWSCPN
jgi:5-methylcytosine-specific restriction endonuclease McrA